MLLRLAIAGLLAALLVRLPESRVVVVEQRTPTRQAPAQVNPSLADHIMADPDLLAGDLLLPLGLEPRDVLESITRAPDELVIDVVRDGEPLRIVVPIAEA